MSLGVLRRDILDEVGALKGGRRAGKTALTAKYLPCKHEGLCLEWRRPGVLTPTSNLSAEKVEGGRCLGLGGQPSQYPW